MKKILFVGLVTIFLLSGCTSADEIEKTIDSKKGGYPRITYSQTSYYADIHNRTFDVPEGYVLNPGHAYDIIDTEEGKDIVFHFVKETE